MPRGEVSLARPAPCTYNHYNRSDTHGAIIMASIRKQSRDKGQKNKPYYVQYVDHEGTRVTVKGLPTRP